MTALTADPIVLVSTVFEDYRYARRTSETVEPVLWLTPREVLMLRWAAEGLETPAMARRSGTPVAALNRCWKRLLTHLHTPTRAAAVALALRAGVIQ